MRLGNAEAYTVEGVTFYVRSDWRSRREHTDRVRALQLEAQGADPEDAEKARELWVQREQAALRLIEQTVAKIDGLEDADGNPVVAWSEDVCWSLPEIMVEDLVVRILQYESDKRLGEAPNPNPEAATTSSPSPETST